MAESTIVKKATLKGYLDNPSVKARINELLRDRAPQFVTSLLSLTSNDALLAEAEPGSLFNAALTAASLDLPINKNLGFAHIIGYRNNRKNIVEAQFQIGYKGFIQLAQRTGQYERIAATEVYEGQLIEEDPLAGNVYNWKARKSDVIVGYVSRFTLTTGFKSDLYMSVEELKKHAQQYSQAYKKKYGPWVDNFDAMALKTVIKLNLAKYGPQSTELQKAITFDQGVVKSDDSAEYPDGMDLDNVGADDTKKADIIAANAPEADTVDDEPPIKPATPDPVPGNNLNGPDRKPAAKPRVDVKAKAKEFVAKGQAANAAKNGGQQASLVDDDDNGS